MKTRTFFLAILLFFAFLSEAQQPQLTWRFTNAKVISGNPSIFQFDVEVKCNQEGTYQSDMQIYFNYNTFAFGENIRGIPGNINFPRKIHYRKLELIQGEFAGISKYNIVNDANNTSSRYAIITEASFPMANPLFMNEVDTDFKGFLQFQIKIEDYTQLAGIEFKGFLMNGGEYYRDANSQISKYFDPCLYDNDLLEVSLLPDLPTSYFKVSDTIICCDENVMVRYTGNASDTATYYWDFDGATILSGSGQGPFTINWTTVGEKNISLIVNENGLISEETIITVEVNSLPSPAGPIIGETLVYAGQSGVHYYIDLIPNADTYVWSLPTEAYISSGYGTNEITVNFTETAISGDIAVYGKNDCGDGESSSLYITIYNDHFIPVWQGSAYLPMTFTVFSAQIEGVNMNANDEIGIFDGDICVGTAKLISEIPPYIQIIASADDPNTSEIDGFIEGNNITYKFWESNGQTFYENVQVIYISGSGTFENLGSVGIKLAVISGNYQNITLNTGWNIMSFNTIHASMDMLEIVQPLINAGHLFKVMDERGNTVEEFPEYGWLNFINKMEITEGYYIKVNNNSQLIVCGPTVQCPVEIPLTLGWNIIGYPCISPQDALLAVKPLINSGILIKVIDQKGNTIENLPDYGWVNFINNFEAGEGYYVKVNSNTTLTINEPYKSYLQQELVTDFNQSVHFEKINKGYPFKPMSIIINCSKLNNINSLAGDEIGIYDGDICVGAGILSDNTEKPLLIAATSDDSSTDKIDGFISGNTITMKYWDNSEEQYKDVEFNYNPDYSDSFGSFETAILEIKALVENVNMTSDYLGDNYPNPFDYQTTISYGIKENVKVLLEVYNINGQKIKTLINNDLKAGNYEVIWDRRNNTGELCSSGIYFYKMKAGKFISIKKMIIK
ncbi:MAG: T9SS type A sorting domain-containing protein [Bacteroidales bacterium]|nr:T9SS type A sorting domain-containing protein [Bacteroidales bacterium]